MIAALASCRKAREETAVETSFDVGPDWYGPGGVGDYASSHGNTPEVLRLAHLVREGAFDAPSGAAIDANEEYDLVVVGGGIAGLAAAHHFRRLSPSDALDRSDNPVRIRSSAMVVRIEHDAGGDVDVTYALGEELHRLKIS